MGSALRASTDGNGLGGATGGRETIRGILERLCLI